MHKFYAVVLENADTLSCQRLQDSLYVSTLFHTPEGAAFVKEVQNAKAILNGISMLVCPQLFSLETKAIEKLKWKEYLTNWHENVNLWPSFFSKIKVISNWKTPVHHDSKAAGPAYDFLVSAGKHTGAWLHLANVKAELQYDPCTVVALHGKLLRHSMPDWDTGERLCISHFIRDAVHNCLKVQQSEWVYIEQYIKMMDEKFVTRQRWDVDD